MFKKKRKVGRPSNASIRREKRTKLFMFLFSLTFVGVSLYSVSDYMKGNSDKIGAKVVSWTYNGIKYSCPNSYDRSDNKHCKKVTKAIVGGTTCDYSLNKDNSYKGYEYKSDTKKCEKKVSGSTVDKYSDATFSYSYNSSECSSKKGITNRTGGCYYCSNGETPMAVKRSSDGSSSSYNYKCPVHRSCSGKNFLRVDSGGYNCYAQKEPKKYYTCSSSDQQLTSDNKCVKIVNATISSKSDAEKKADQKKSGEQKRDEEQKRSQQTQEESSNSETSSDTTETTQNNSTSTYDNSNSNTQTYNNSTSSSGNIKNASVSSIPDQAYTGKKIKPKFTVTLNGYTLEKGKDYKVKYTNNKKAGTAKIKITGIGNFKGTKKVTFKIIDEFNSSIEGVVTDDNSTDIPESSENGESQTSTKAHKVNIKIYVGKITETNPPIVKTDFISKDHYLLNNNGSDILYKIKYGEKLSKYGLRNLDSKTEYCLAKKGYKIKEGEEYICTSGCKKKNKTFNDETAYSSKDFCDASKGDCTVILKVNWVKGKGYNCYD